MFTCNTTCKGICSTNLKSARTDTHIYGEESVYTNTLTTCHKIQRFKCVPPQNNTHLKQPLFVYMHMRSVINSIGWSSERSNNEQASERATSDRTNERGAHLPQQLCRAYTHAHTNCLCRMRLAGVTVLACVPIHTETQHQHSPASQPMRQAANKREIPTARKSA